MRYTNKTSPILVGFLFLVHGGIHAGTAVTGTALPPGLALHLSFEPETVLEKDGGFFVRDLSGNGQDGRIAKPSFAPGRRGMALDMNGKDGFISGSDHALPSGGNPSTVSLWFFSRNKEFQGLFAHGSTSKRAARGVALKEKALCLYRWMTPAADANVTEWQTNQWHHIVVTYDQNIFQAYFNGQATNPVELSLDTKAGRYVIGGLLDGTKRFDGLIDEVMVFDRKLTFEEIQALFKIGTAAGP